VLSSIDKSQFIKVLVWLIQLHLTPYQLLVMENI